VLLPWTTCFGPVHLSPISDLPVSVGLRRARGTPVYIAPELYAYSLEDDARAAAKPKASTEGSGSAARPKLSTSTMRTSGARTVALATAGDGKFVVFFDNHSKVRSGTDTQIVPVYAYGILLWEIAVTCFVGRRVIPYHEDQKGLTDAAIMIRVARQGMRPKTRSEIPPALTDLMQQCWHEKPHYRPTMTQTVERLEECLADLHENPESWRYEYSKGSKSPSRFTLTRRSSRQSMSTHEDDSGTLFDSESSSTHSTGPTDDLDRAKLKLQEMDADLDGLEVSSSGRPGALRRTETIGRARKARGSLAMQREFGRVGTVSAGSSPRPKLHFTETLGRRSSHSVHNSPSSRPSLAAMMLTSEEQEEDAKPSLSRRSSVRARFSSFSRATGKKHTKDET
jgi:Protein tyrosine and serine/threonine kinase